MLFSNTTRERGRRWRLAAVEEANAGPEGDAGYNAYYAFMLTQDPPPPLSFAAIGQRDLQRYVLRVRVLGLQAQLYDSETYNPELALPGVFDWAFVLIYLMPLVIIALGHDLVTGERETGRLRLLLSLPGGGLWRRRVGLRYAAVLIALGLPWAIASVYHAVNGRRFCFPAGALSFSVAIFGGCAVLCLSLLAWLLSLPLFAAAVNLMGRGRAAFSAEETARREALAVKPSTDTPQRFVC